MSTDDLSVQNVRHLTRRALQFMNQYSLTEFEYEDKSSDQTLRLRRSDTDSSPPLLEGRSERLPGQIRSPTVGRLVWDVEAGSSVEHGEKVAEITKKEETVPVKAPKSGTLTETMTSDYVEFGDILGVVVSESDDEGSNDG